MRRRWLLILGGVIVAFLAWASIRARGIPYYLLGYESVDASKFQFVSDPKRKPLILHSARYGDRWFADGINKSWRNGFCGGNLIEFADGTVEFYASIELSKDKHGVLRVRPL